MYKPTSGNFPLANKHVNLPTYLKKYKMKGVLCKKSVIFLLWGQISVTRF